MTFDVDRIRGVLFKRQGDESECSAASHFRLYVDGIPALVIGDVMGAMELLCVMVIARWSVERAGDAIVGLLADTVGCVAGSVGSRRRAFVDTGTRLFSGADITAAFS